MCKYSADSLTVNPPIRLSAGAVFVRILTMIEFAGLGLNLVYRLLIYPTHSIPSQFMTR